MKIFGISKNTLYDLIKNGSIPAVRLGNKLWRIGKQGLISYVDNNA